MTSLNSLAALDPARHISDDAAHTPSARQALMTAMAQGDAAPAATPITKRRGFKATLISAPLVAASSAVAFFTLGTAGTSPAFASWQATPTAPSSAARAAAVKICGVPSNEAHTGAQGVFSPRLVEQRGEFTYVVLGSDKGWEATCLMRGNPASPSMEQGLVAPLKTTPKPDGLVTNSVRQVDGDDDDDKWQEVTGRASSQVASVEFLANGTRVKATLNNGYFAAWWPGKQGYFHYGPPNPDVVITLKDGRKITKQIQDFDISPM